MEKGISLRIVHVYNWFVPGLGYEENYLPKAQASLGQDVTLIASTRTPALLRSTFPKRVDTHQASKCGSKTPETDLTLLRLHSTPEMYGQVILMGLGKLLREVRPDVVHAHGAFSPNSVYCALLQKKLGYVLFVDDHTSYDLTNTAGPKAVYVALVRQFYHSHMSVVSKFLPVTPAAAVVLQVELHIPTSQLQLTSLGADHRFFFPSERERLSTRRRLGIEDREALLISTGRFGSEKRLDLIIKALDLVQLSGHANTRLLLAGSAKSDYLDQMKNLCRKLNLEKRVLFSDFLPHQDLPGYYNAADIGVWPGSHTISVLEAVATGLPCIVPAASAYEPLLKAEACLSYDPGNVEDLAICISKLLDDPGYVNRVRLSARRAVEREFSWDSIAKKTLVLYARTLDASF